MTSSLVGSEMCIRDRPFAVRSSSGPLLLDRRLFGLGLACGTRVSLMSVSYTHLTLPTICSV
eukprot:11183658-Prorocentrum_lima.AAC.1